LADLSFSRTMKLTDSQFNKDIRLFDINLTHDLEYLFIFITVLIVPKLLLRLRVPSGITALAIGLLFSQFDPTLRGETLFRFLSQIGITSLFLFAGLEVDIKELKEDRVYLSKYLGKFLVLLSLITVGFYSFLNWEWKVALIFSLGIFTPSAGFIINSLHSFNMGEDQEYWIKSKAISKEVLSIFLLFIALQWGDPARFFFSSLFFAALFLILPMVFRIFFKFISPYAPNSEIPFLVALSLISGVLSKEIGAYYLVGAFIVGITGSRFRSKIFTEGEDALFRSLSGFFNVFLPFYFFYAGTKLSLNAISLESFYFAGILFLLFLPLRLLIIKTSLRFFMDEIIEKTYQVSFALMPTLIFGLVIANVLMERELVAPKYSYALIIYTLLTSLFPTIMFSLRKFKAGPSKVNNL
jgi:Kef-type K+ transport system membrane component KefB